MTQHLAPRAHPLYWAFARCWGPLSPQPGFAGWTGAAGPLHARGVPKNVDANIAAQKAAIHNIKKCHRRMQAARRVGRPMLHERACVVVRRVPRHERMPAQCAQLGRNPAARPRACAANAPPTRALLDPPYKRWAALMSPEPSLPLPAAAGAPAVARQQEERLRATKRRRLEQRRALASADKFLRSHKRRAWRVVNGNGMRDAALHGPATILPTINAVSDKQKSAPRALHRTFTVSAQLKMRDDITWRRARWLSTQICHRAAPHTSGHGAVREAAKSQREWRSP